MHASRLVGATKSHVSGAERLVLECDFAATFNVMSERAMSRSADHFTVSAERVAMGECQHAACLGVQTVIADNSDEAANFAKSMLSRIGVSSNVASLALRAITDGLGANGASLRGASLWDRSTGDRLEPNLERGIRASRFDYSAEGALAVDAALQAQSLTHFRVREALAMATKTSWSGVMAELCWSDEPEYHTGYIASPNFGYLRMPGFKPDGARGGRIFFVNRTDDNLQEIIHRLEKKYVLIQPPVTVSEPISIKDYQSRL
jgi:6-carboxyhexanoate--CoA ligase